MGQEVVVPDAFKGGMAKSFQQALPNESLADGIGQSYGVISYKGKVWSIRHRGERKAVIRPDDQTPSSYIDVVILSSAVNKSKSYYKAFDAAQSEGDRPICSSIDGVTPDLDVAEKQCDACALCPRNQWKTQPNGRKGRECTDYKRLAVLVMPTQTTPVFGKALMEPLFLRVPPDSLNSLANMGETMDAQGYKYSSYVTRITFDPQKAHPCMIFRPLQPLTDQEAPVILDLRKNPTVDRITLGDTAAVTGTAAVKEAMQPAGTNTTGLTLAASHPSGGVASEVISASPLTSSTISVALPVTNPPNGGGTDTGLLGTSSPTPAGSASGGANTVTPASVAPAMPSTAVTGDAGAPEYSDDELDAQLAALIAKK